MNIRKYESRKTHQVWGSGHGSPSLMILTSLIVNTIALLVVIIVNTTVVDDGSNDYGQGFGWTIMTPAPAAGILWALLDVVVVRFSVLHPIYYLTEASFLMVFNLVMGAMSISFYSWDSDGSWVPGIFILISGVVYLAIMVISAVLVHKRKTRPQQSYTA
ncbi:hypothetical protein E4T42_08912 [Aureobasidium subglaciale]|nr:hypothetical protein E4T42_08912 [Aureobasidium subglaciale]